MGLTLHYTLKTRIRKFERILALVKKMRDKALDLPFEHVEELRHLGPEVCQVPLDDLRDKAREEGSDEQSELAFSMVLDGCVYVDFPGNPHLSTTVQPLDIVGFHVNPVKGSEWPFIGFARYPSTVEVEHRGEKREIPVNHPGWSLHSFCKTQYASNPEHGGVENFLRAHLSVISLLRYIRDDLGVGVEINDEGCFERWHGYAVLGDESTLGWHEGHGDVRKLAEEVGEWNTMIASFSGALKDMMGEKGALESEITKFPNFEHLEAKGSGDSKLETFVKALTQHMRED